VQFFYSVEKTVVNHPAQQGVFFQWERRIVCQSVGSDQGHFGKVLVFVDLCQQPGLPSKPVAQSLASSLVYNAPHAFGDQGFFFCRIGWLFVSQAAVLAIQAAQIGHVKEPSVEFLQIQEFVAIRQQGIPFTGRNPG